MILDTNAVSALFVGDPALAALLDSEDRHHLPSIVIGEYRYGLQRSSHRNHLEPLLAALIRESFILVVDEVTATAYSKIRNALRKLGRPIPENDVWIAALAIQHGVAVVTRDGHFGHVPGISCRDW